MPSLPVLSGLECIKALRKLGYEEARQQGSHVRLRCPGRPPVTVPIRDTLDRGTLRAILRTAELTVEEFLSLVR